MSPENASTEILVKKAQQGQRAALDELWERHRPRLLRMLRCRLDPRVRPRIDESDIAQETLVLAHRDLANYQPRNGVSFFAWLRRIAWRQLLRASERHLGARRRSALKEIPIRQDELHTTLHDPLVTASTPSGAVARKELEHSIAAALEEMASADRAVLVLRYFEQLSSREIAAVLGISQPAYRMRLVRALAHLRDVLGGLDESFEQ